MNTGFFFFVIMATGLVLTFDTIHAEDKLKCTKTDDCAKYCSQFTDVHPACLGGYCECLRWEGGISS
uniref:Potassium channel toxin alpha-KTx 30.1 n=1 Tax=Scorpiops margerisonae TaxID=856992 RepID=KA301_SCOR|nr:RecName: Full=Potassium channel toxin alpha-KTx 30.1; AltName: Full=Toxin SjKTx23; AltName: Full=Toxin StKTx23; Flags: Precursor [Scorpiops margerisonae]